MTATAEPKTPPPPARLVIVDDQELAREGFRRMLEGVRDLDIIGEATSGAEARELCRRLQPDLALIDIRMPEMNGLETTRAVRQVSPQTRVIIVAMHAPDSQLQAAIHAGAAGYIPRDTTRQDFLAVVRAVLRPRCPLAHQSLTEVNPTMITETTLYCQIPMHEPVPPLAVIIPACNEAPISNRRFDMPASLPTSSSW
ncbi:MAG: response regulator transcription factor [Chloroflexaceae bacterium]|nr:response regulator transcription factor [Chloroflexaceae bacterium]